LCDVSVLVREVELTIELLPGEALGVGVYALLKEGHASLIAV